MTLLEERLIACFVEVALAFNLPRSMGEIFGLIYASEEPVCFEGIRERLQISEASTSTGLKELQCMRRRSCGLCPGGPADVLPPGRGSG